MDELGALTLKIKSLCLWEDRASAHLLQSIFCNNLRDYSQGLFLAFACSCSTELSMGIAWEFMLVQACHCSPYKAEMDFADGLWDGPR